MDIGAGAIMINLNRYIKFNNMTAEQFLKQKHKIVNPTHQDYIAMKKEDGEYYTFTVISLMEQYSKYQLNQFLEFLKENKLVDDETLVKFLNK